MSNGTIHCYDCKEPPLIEKAIQTFGWMRIWFVLMNGDSPSGKGWTTIRLCKKCMKKHLRKALEELK